MKNRPCPESRRNNFLKIKFLKQPNMSVADRGSLNHLRASEQFMKNHRIKNVLIHLFFYFKKSKFFKNKPNKII